MTETEITDQAKEAIKQISNNHNADAAAVEERYADLLEEEAEKGVSNPERRALRRLSLSYKGGESNRTEPLRGYALGASDPINTAASAVNRAKNFIENRGYQQAIKQGMIKAAPSGGLPDELASITVTEGDEQKEFAVLDSNSNSPTAGEVLPAKDYIRYVYGAVWRGPEDGPHLFSGVVSADDHSRIPPAPPVGDAVSFEAVWVGESDQNNTIRLRFRDEQPFETVEDFGGPDLIDLLDSELGEARVPLEGADSSKFGRNDVAVTYGSVTYMELSPDEGQSRRLAVVDPFAFDSDLSRTVWVPEHTEINFGEESDVFIIGQVSKSNNEYPDSIEALGVIPHPDYVVDRSGIEPMADNDDDAGAEEPETIDGDPESGGSDDEGSESVEPEAEGEPASAQAAMHTDESPPQTEHEAEFETGDTIDESEQAEKAEDGEHLPDIVTNADYTDLQAAAANVDAVPGSGIGADEMRDRLLDEIGTEALVAALADETGDGDRPEGEADAVAGSGDEPAEQASTDGGESVTQEDEGPFEPTEEDEDWSW